MNNKIWAGIAGAVAAGIALYLLTGKNKAQNDVDLSVFTKDQLLKIIDQFEIDHIKVFIHGYSQLKANTKSYKQSKFLPQDVEETKKTLSNLWEEVNNIILKENNISMEFLDQWIDTLKNDEDVQKASRSMNKNYDLILGWNKPEFDTEPPKEITKEILLKFISTSYTMFRIHVYRKVQEWLKQNPNSQLTDPIFKNIWKEWSLSEKKLLIYIMKWGYQLLKMNHL